MKTITWFIGLVLMVVSMFLEEKQATFNNVLWAVGMLIMFMALLAGDIVEEIKK